MKKRILSVLLAVVLLLSLLPLSFAGADGASYYDGNTDSYLYNEPRLGIVICRQMNVRDRAATSGATLGQIRNGQPVKIMGTSRDGNFYALDLESCGITNQGAGAVGFAKASLIKMDPEFIATTKLTNLYATPWTTELKNGEQTGRFFLMLGQYNNWYAVQAMETSPGTAFIRTGDVGQYSPYYAMYVVTWDSPAYDGNTWAQIAAVKRFSVGRLMNVGSDYTLLLFNEGKNNEYSAWIPNLYVAPIIN